MFAPRLRPLARTVARRAFATASSSSRPAARVSQQTHNDYEGGKELLLMGGAFAALFVAGSVVIEQRENRKAPSPEKEVEAEEEVAEEETGEVVEESHDAAKSALDTVAAQATAVDDSLEGLVAAAKAALSNDESTGMPTPEEAANQGAFNEETGEINWDCPCLGGMAHGPCGEEFKAAFSCFVYSEEEPKGVDCVEKFKAMQDCFRQHPDVYAEEIDDDDEAQAEAEAQEGEEPKKE